MMIEKNEKTFLYVQARVTQNFNETWFYVFQQAAVFMTPILLCVCFMQRAITFQLAADGSTEFDFSSTIAKIQEASSDPAQPYDLFKDREQISVFVGEIRQKGLFPHEY